MKVIGFNFTKISAEKLEHLGKGFSVNTDVEFTNLEKEEIPALKEEALKISFRYKVTFSSNEKDKKPKAELIIEGAIILSTEKDEAKDLQKSWKKKEMSPALKVPLFNLILKKCSPKALQLEDELNLPFHLPIPQLKPQQAPAKEEKK